MGASKKTVRRQREKIDPEFAAMSDMFMIAEKLCSLKSWRVGLRAVLFVAMRISPSRARKVLAEFLADDAVGW